MAGARALWNPRGVSGPTKPREPGPRVVDPLDLEPRDDSHLPAVPDEDDRDLDEITYDSFSTVMGAVERSGNWQAAGRIRARSIMGELKLDFREAELPPDGMVEIHCAAILGNIELVVPAGAEIEMEGVKAFVGELKQVSGRPKKRPFMRRVLEGEEHEQPPATPRPGEGLLFVVTGRIVMGGITVTNRSD